MYFWSGSVSLLYQLSGQFLIFLVDQTFSWSTKLFFGLPNFLFWYTKYFFGTYTNFFFVILNIFCRPNFFLVYQNFFLSTKFFLVDQKKWEIDWTIESRPCGFGQSLGQPIVRSISHFFWLTKEKFVQYQIFFVHSLEFFSSLFWKCGFGQSLGWPIVVIFWKRLDKKFKRVNKKDLRLD